MACTKSELVSAINSYSAAYQTGDKPLIQMAIEKLNSVIDTLTFEAEEESTDDNQPN